MQSINNKFIRYYKNVHKLMSLPSVIKFSDSGFQLRNTLYNTYQISYNGRLIALLRKGNVGNPTFLIRQRDSDSSTANKKLEISKIDIEDRLISLEQHDISLMVLTYGHDWCAEPDFSRFWENMNFIIEFSNFIEKYFDEVEKREDNEHEY